MLRLQRKLWWLRLFNFRVVYGLHLSKQQKAWWLTLHDCRVWVVMELVKIGAAMLSAVELTEAMRRR